MADQRYFPYDVFLLTLCGGSDIRDGDSGHLLEALRDRGIRTFVNEDKELQSSIIPRVDEIPAELVMAIEESRISIVVFTDNYDVSSLRLEVLAYIFDYFGQNDRLVFPVYYANRFDAYHGIISRCKPFNIPYFLPSKSRKKLFEKVEKMSNALRRVREMSGWDLDRTGEMKNKREFSRDVASKVSEMLTGAPLHIADYPVGLRSRLKEVCSLLEMRSYDREVLMVGIYGVAGIGKSTLARALYNGIRHRFKHSCFLHNVRENSNKYGLVHLQNMLLSEIVRKKDIQLGNSSEGVSMIKRRLHQHQVLFILDDVDSLEQLEALVGEPDWFGPGSRVIIITRNRNLLAHHKVERIYLVEELNRTHARKLLSHKVFKHGIVNPSYTDILGQIVTYASGLPLALERIGSYLYGKSVDEWRYALDRFKRIPYYDIPRILKANIDALEEAEQSIFQEALHSVSEVSQTSQSILQVSHASMKVVGVSSHSSESDFEVSLTSQSVFEDSQTSQSVHEVLQTIRVMLQTSRVFQAEEMCRLVGLVSSVVGLSCHALSPSFKRLIRGWNPFKFFLYGVLSLVICASVLFAKSSSFSIKHKNYTCFAVFMIISVYSFLYDKAVDGKPELLSLASNVASALASLSLSKLVKFGFETGTFCYFLGCFTIQLLTIDWKLILVAIIVDFPLFVMHLSSDSQPKDGHGCQTIPLWTPNN